MLPYGNESSVKALFTSAGPHSLHAVFVNHHLYSDTRKLIHTQRWEIDNIEGLVLK